MVVEENKQNGREESLNEGTENGSPSKDVTTVEIPGTISVRQLAELLNISAIDVIKKLMRSGIMANINQVIDYEAAAAIAGEFGYEARPQPLTARSQSSVISEIKKQQLLNEESINLKPRPPVVTIMGHVDHGKTRLLDAIRQTNVMDTEAGGITQHIGAYQVEIDGKKITFLDTPGHEAFTAMRARGARVTDITVLVVAADDGVMPQTKEAIDHARAAGVPIVVALNKIDKPDANPELAKKQMADVGLVIEEWGGDIVCVPTSAKNKTGIPELLENILLVAEMENLRADPSLPAKGVVIEAKLDKAKGPLATVLIHDGSLKLGDMVVVGSTWGRVKAMFNDTGKRVRRARPSSPVVVLGLHSVPQVGDTLTAVAGERQARDMVEENQQKSQQATKTVSLINLFDQISAGKVQELDIIFKADVQGSVEPIKISLERLTTDAVQVKIVHSGSGNITESDVMLAVASKGLVIAFNTKIEAGAQKLAEAEGIDIRSYKVIYDLIGDVEKALKGMLTPEFVDVIDGRAEVRVVFPASKRNNIAGVYVIEGKISRGVTARLRRKEKIVSESSVNSLRRFKDDVKEVSAGYECGVGIKDYSDFQIGDILEFFRKEKVG
ncbi:MAG: translation initiation factor IF-2 [Dehalococcoidales bacterium]|nr:translation initiation factor IF-2 [Dehalococcoidales bacterium]